MNETIQTIIVAIAITCSSVYAILRIRKALRNKGGACDGCPLKNACRKDKPSSDCKKQPGPEKT